MNKQHLPSTSPNLLVAHYRRHWSLEIYFFNCYISLSLVVSLSFSVPKQLMKDVNNYISPHLRELPQRVNTCSKLANGICMFLQIAELPFLKKKSLDKLTL